MIIEFKFTIGQRVTIIEIKRPGIVTGMSFDEVGRQIRVAYWNDGKRCTDWMYETEVEAQ